MGHLVFFIHLLAVFALVCGNVAGLLATLKARTATAPAAALAAIEIHRTAVTALVIPGLVGSLVTGLLLAWVAGIGILQFWVVASIVVWAIAMALGTLVLAPALSRAHREALRLVEAGETEMSRELSRLVGATIVLRCEWLSIGLMIVLTYLMIFKP